MICTLTLNPCLDLHYAVSHVELDSVNKATEQHLRLGGKGINVSRQLQQAGVQPLVTMILGGTSMDGMLEHLATKDGLQLTILPGASEPRFNIHVREQTGERRLLKVNAPGGVVESEVLHVVLEQLNELSPAHLVLCGSLPPGLPVDSYAQIIRSAKLWNGKTYLDCRDEPLVEAMKAKPDFVKINLEELQVLQPEIEESELATELPRIATDFGTRFCITNGGGRVYYSDGEQLISKQPPNLNAGETVGAGDAFMAGWVAGEVYGFGANDCLENAMRFAEQSLSV